MIMHAPMGNICRPLDYGSGGTEAIVFIQCINGQEPQIHELWCLSLDGIRCEVRPTARAEVTARTVGEFVTYYLTENGHQIEMFGQIFVNDSVQFWDCPTKPGEVDCCLFETCWLTLRLQGG